MQLFMMSGISWLVASRYSSRLPAKSLGWPMSGVRPIRLRRGLLPSGVAPPAPPPPAPPTVSLGDVGSCVPSWPKDLWISSYLAVRRCIRFDPITYSRNFCKLQSISFHFFGPYSRCVGNVPLEMFHWKCSTIRDLLPEISQGSVSQWACHISADITDR